MLEQIRRGKKRGGKGVRYHLTFGCYLGLGKKKGALEKGCPGSRKGKKKSIMWDISRGGGGCEHSVDE